jgi:EAL domain-containing protein (putative c-di-GMP-specific phosphodiesterase class I)
MEDPGRTVHMLKTIRDMGIAIALDDFGTEYSSLGYLTQFPLDYMKIDQSFLRGVPEATDNVAITRAIITLGKNLGLQIIAEGVENEAQLRFVAEQGCEEYQGYLFSRPVPAEELAALFRKNVAAQAA